MKENKYFELIGGLMWYSSDKEQPNDTISQIFVNQRKAQKEVLEIMKI